MNYATTLFLAHEYDEISYERKDNHLKRLNRGTGHNVTKQWCLKGDFIGSKSGNKKRTKSKKKKRF